MRRSLVSLVPASVLLAFAISAAAQSVSCNVIAVGTPPANDAQRAYQAGKFADAEKQFRALLQASPNDASLLAGLVRSLLAQQQVDAAWTSANEAVKAQPSSAAVESAFGEVLFRQGKIAEADQAFAQAKKLDPCFARAYLGTARVARASSMYATEKKLITIAHQLDASDPGIERAWENTLPITQRIEEVKRSLAASTGQSDEQRAHLQHYLDHLQQAAAGNHLCRIESAAASAEIPFVPLLHDATHIRAWGLDTKINGASARLQVDTGASRLYIGRAFAQRAGLKAEEKIMIGGIGDRGPQSSYLAYAETIRIGDLEFKDCEVEVSDRREVIGADGIIGMDVFARYLVTLDFPDHKMQLSPLPKRENDSAAVATLEMGSGGGPEDNAPKNETQNETPAESPPAASGTQSGPQDRYIAPEMKAFTPIFRFGHDLLIPTTLNKKAHGLMMIDTGAGLLSISPEIAHQITKVKNDNIDSVRGIAGKVEKLSTGGDVLVQFGPANVTVADILVFDNAHMSRGAGTEVSGFIGWPLLQSLTMQIDYRDGLVNFIYDPKKDAYRSKGPQPPCGGCIPTGYRQ